MTEMFFSSSRDTTEVGNGNAHIVEFGESQILLGEIKENDQKCVVVITP